MAFLAPNAEWLSHARSQAATATPILGAVVTGELASISHSEGTLGAHIVHSLIDHAVDQVEVEGTGSLPYGELAKSAAVYARRRATSHPTYLDTLPAMEVLLEERARPVWRSLLNQEEQYVPGGLAWSTTTDLGGLTIPAGSEELALQVWVEPGEDVRQVKFQLPKPPRNGVAVELRVEIEPAQGQARVELAPKTEGALGGRQVLLDWSRAELLGGTRDDVQLRYPRKCPQVQPRGQWLGASRQVVRALEKIRGDSVEQIEAGLQAFRVDELRKALNTGPQGTQVPTSTSGPIGVYRALNSEGELHPQFKAQMPRLREVLDVLAKRELRALEEGWQPDPASLAVLGYACAQGDSIDALARWITAQDEKITREQAAFLGGCLRDPALIAQFLKLVIKRLERDDGPNDVVKAAGYILQWRDSALNKTDTRTVTNLARAAGQLISWTVEAAHGGEPRYGAKINHRERNSLVLIAFLLRQRITDDAFLKPEGPDAKEVKGVLSVAARGLRDGTMTAIGGMVQSDVLIDRVIDYIERKGTGTISAD